MNTSGASPLGVSVGARPLTGRQCERSKQNAAPLKRPLTGSRRQVTAAKQAVSASAQWALCGPQAAAPQDMSSVSLCQY